MRFVKGHSVDTHRLFKQHPTAIGNVNIQANFGIDNYGHNGLRGGLSTKFTSCFHPFF